MHGLEVKHFKLFTLLGWLEQMQRRTRVIRREAAHLETIHNSIASAVVNSLRDGLVATPRIALKVLVNAENLLAIGPPEGTRRARWLWSALGNGIIACRLRLDRAKRNGSE
jgi:hypothetical protein